MSKRYSFLIILCLLNLFCFSQNTSKVNKIRISGYIYDSKSKETLIGASIFEPKTKTGTITNNYGFFSLSLEKGESDIIISYVGYQKDAIKINATKDTSIQILLNQSSTLKEVVIEDKNSTKRFIEEATPGKIVINPSTITSLPSLTGESDLLKSLQLMPGVKSGTEGTTGLYVRGGNIDQNLYLVDGIPIYNPNHLMGFISTFNTDAIKNIEFYKGAFPARYGGRASSVVDVRMKDGNMDKLSGDISIGLISAKLNLEGPIIKDKTTFNVSLRRTYIDLLMKPIIAYENSQNEDSDFDFGYYFTDLNFKVNHIFNSKSRINASLYLGQDKYYFESKDKVENSTDYSNILSDVKWGNLIGNINWAYEMSQNLFMNISASYNLYSSKINSTMESYLKENNETLEQKFNFNFLSSIEDFSISNDYNFYLNSWNYINFGAKYIYHTYAPELTSIISSNSTITIDNYNVNNKVYGNEVVMYIDDEMNLTEKFSLNPGFHFNIFNVGSQTYYSLQPRMGIRYSFAKNLSFKSGYAMMNQNIHLLANGIISMPTDLWVPVTERIKPITSHQVSAGLFYSLKDWANISCEGYYKYLNNIIDYKDGVSSFNTSDKWEDKVAQGFGEAYGLEFMINKEKGNTTGWVSYTLSWAFREFPTGEINAGKRYYDRFDSRHNINVTVIHKFSNRLDAAASWVFNTGSRLSIPIASYYNPLQENNTNPDYYSEIINIYGDRNNYKMPNYHRLDLSLNFHTRHKYGTSTWSLNIYNVYNRKNPVFVFNSDTPYKLKAYSIMPLIPTIAYTYKFK